VEGVDYGVKKRRSRTPGQEQEDEEKFLKGVRVCRECRPIILSVNFVLWPYFIDIIHTGDNSMCDSISKNQPLLNSMK
jgi:hypothetical protein